MAMATESPKVEDEYASQRPVYEAFTENAFELLKSIIDDAGIEFASMEKRTKSVESLKNKIERGDKAGKYDSLQKITDLSGIRIVTFLKEDCGRISILLREAFVVDQANSIDKEDEIDLDRFGYQSIHLILSYSADRLKLPEFKRFAGLKFEVQVKTLLQHTWSAIDWKLRYKRRSEAPKKLRRRLFRISALLDAADDELSYVYQQVSDIKSYYVAAISRGDLSLEFNRDSIDALISNRASRNGSIAKIVEKLKPVPKVNQTEEYESSSIEKLLLALKAAGITQLQQLDTRIQSLDDKHISKFQAAVSGWLTEVKIVSWNTARYDIARMAILMTATKETANEILNVAPFNPILTPKIRREIGI